MLEMQACSFQVISNSFIFNGRCFTGWGNLVFFDIEEHQIPTDGEPKMLADIPRLGTQWKIIHEFKPTEYPPAGDPTKSTFGLGVTAVSAGNPIQLCILMGLSPPNIRLVHCIYEGHNTIQATPFLGSSQLPEVGEWTRIEISHEEVEIEQLLPILVCWRQGGWIRRGWPRSQEINWCQNRRRQLSARICPKTGCIGETIGCRF